MIPFIITGLTTGAVYGLAAVGLVLVYKTSGVFNFAHGALATIAAYVFYELYVLHGVNWELSAVVAVLGVGLALGPLFERLAVALDGSSLVVRVVSTVGVVLVIQAGVLLIYGETTVQSIPQFLPTGTHKVFGAFVTDAQIVTVIFAIAATAALYAVLRFTRLGISMRAVVDNPSLLDDSGTSPARVRRYAWIIGVVLATASGVLIAPQQASLSGQSLTLLVLQAFGAAAIGVFSSLPLTFAGGLAIGVAGSLCTKYFTAGLLAGLAPTLSFVVLFLVLLLLPKRRLATRAAARTRPASTWSTPWPIQAAGAAAVLVVLICVPGFAGIHLTAWTQALAAVISFLALGLLVRTSGQVSLCHVSFLAIGACGLSHLAVDHGVPWGAAVLLSGLIAVPVGAVLAIPAIRLSGLYLALATFGFGVLLSYMFYTQPYMFGQNGLGLNEPRPALSWLNLSGDKAYYYLVLVITVVVTAAVIGMTRSRLGRLLRALADSPTALASGGTSVVVTNVLVFCVSAFLAAIAGALDASAQSVVSGDLYQPLLSLTYLALAMISIGREPWYALMAAAGLVIIPSYVPAGGNINNWLTLAFGVFAATLAFSNESNRRTQERIAAVLDPLFRRRARSREITLAPLNGGGILSAAPLAVEGLTVAFGGLVAVADVSLTAPGGKITGLIGPNGAGKTTTFNAVSGLNAPAKGRILLGGQNISRLGPAARARRGLGRTFQQMELFDSLTVEQNVRMGLESRIAGANVLRHLVPTQGQGRRIAAAADRAMVLCGVAGLASRPVADLSTGQRRLVDLARCLAPSHRMLLLDEPSSGLDRAETAEFGRILTGVVRDRGVGVFLVEHDMSLVMSICDYLYVLDFGKLIFEGTPADARVSPVVRSAYLGEADDAADDPAADPADDAAEPVPDTEAL